MRRHDLATLRPEAPLEPVLEQPSGALQHALAHWVSQQQPLVVTRQPAEGAHVLLAVTLCLHDQRRRYCGRVHPQDILRVTPPLSIRHCLDRLPHDQARVLEQLEVTLSTHAIRAGVYGSLSWEALSGQRYRHAHSDIDLICDVNTPAQAVICLEALHATAHQLSCPLDGEIRFPDQRAVAWKEWAAAQHKASPRQVLVKGNRTVELCPVGALWDSFAHG